MCPIRDGWYTFSCRGAQATSRGGRSSHRGAQQGSLAPEVVAFDDFVIVNGGDCGGWEKDDHEEFVNVLKACKGDYTQAGRDATGAVFACAGLAETCTE